MASAALKIFDHLSPWDPQAIGSRADLVRLHRMMGTVSILLRFMQGSGGCAGADHPIRILELGAGDGSLLLRLATRLVPTWPRVELTLMDRQALVSPQTIEAYARLGWTVSAVVANVLDWASEESEAGHWHIVIANLFLHHFEQLELRQVLRRAGLCRDRFVACEPRRSAVALAASHLVGLVGANAVTREDAVLSVQAGFRDAELSDAWPGDKHQWHLVENSAGLFSYCFTAQRRTEHGIGRSVSGSTIPMLDT